MTKCQFCLFVNPVPDFPIIDGEIKPHDYQGLCGKPAYGFYDTDKPMEDWWEAVLYKQLNGTVVLLVNNGDGYWITPEMTFEYCPKCGRRLNA